MRKRQYSISALRVFSTYTTAKTKYLYYSAHAFAPLVLIILLTVIPKTTTANATKDTLGYAIEFISFHETYPIDDEEITVVPLNALNQDSLAAIIITELAKYPKTVIKDVAKLNAVFICGGIYTDRNFNYPIHGTYVETEDKSYIIVDGTAKVTAQVVHHELSSILFHQLGRRSVSCQTKNRLLTENFKGVTNYVSHVPGKAFVMPKLRNNQVVLGTNGYALDGFENDFNTIAECLFSPRSLRKSLELILDPGSTLWEFLDIAKSRAYPVYKKVEWTIEYYRSINPMFTENYFRKLEQMAYEND